MCCISIELAVFHFRGGMWTLYCHAAQWRPPDTTGNAQPALPDWEGYWRQDPGNAWPQMPGVFQGVKFILLSSTVNGFFQNGVAGHSQVLGINQIYWDFLLCRKQTL